MEKYRPITEEGVAIDAQAIVGDGLRSIREQVRFHLIEREEQTSDEFYDILQKVMEIVDKALVGCSLQEARFFYQPN